VWRLATAPPKPLAGLGRLRAQPCLAAAAFASAPDASPHWLPHQRPLQQL